VLRKVLSEFVEPLDRLLCPVVLNMLAGKRVRATSSLGVPPSTAASTRSLKSFEYGFMPEG